MLPALPSPFACQADLRRLLGRVLLPLILVLPLVLAGCGGPGQPPHGVLLDALALQIQLTQGAISQALELEAPGLPQVSRVRVEDQAAIDIGPAKGLRLTGHFDWRLAGDPIRVDSPFELYLERGERDQSWRLARPTGSTTAAGGSVQEWTTYPLPLPGEGGRS